MQVPVPVTKISESEILPARIAPQLRSADSSPKADEAAAEEEPHEPAAQPSAGECNVKCPLPCCGLHMSDSSQAILMITKMTSSNLITIFEGPCTPSCQ